jgi:hypothetical protein
MADAQAWVTRAPPGERAVLGIVPPAIVQKKVVWRRRRAALWMRIAVRAHVRLENALRRRVALTVTSAWKTRSVAH